MMTFLNDTEGSRSRRTLMVAGLDSVAELGIDNSTASDIIKRANVSRPTFYSYFDDVPGLMADCWVAGGREWLNTVMWNELPEGFEDSNEHKAYVDVLMSTTRTPELAEIVLPDIVNHWTELQTRSESEQVRRVWMLATRLGMTATEAVMPEVRTLKKFVDGLSLIPDDLKPDPSNIDAVKTGEPVVSNPAIADEDEVTSRLVQAVVRVVANSGVAKASMTRVCRAAHVTTGSAKPRFATMADLMSRGYEYAVMEVARQNVEQADSVFKGVTPIQAYVRLVNSSLHPSRKAWRRYRQEMHLAARVDKAISKQMAAGIKQVNQVLADSIRAVGVDESIVDVAIRINQAQSVGFSMLDELGIPVRELNNAIIPTLISVDVLAALS